MPEPLPFQVTRSRGVRRQIRVRLRKVPAGVTITSLSLVVPSLALAVAGTLGDDGWWTIAPSTELADAAVGTYPAELVVDRGMASEEPVAAGQWVVLARVA